jgi:hypothetical protein
MQQIAAPFRAFLYPLGMWKDTGPAGPIAWEGPTVAGAILVMVILLVGTILADRIRGRWTGPTETE